jgi:hypothetical protein
VVTTPGGEERTIHRRVLNPRAHAGDQGAQDFSVSLPDDRDLRVAIRTRPGASAEWDWSYVGKLQCSSVASR